MSVKIRPWKVWRSYWDRRPSIDRSADRIDFDLRIDRGAEGFRAKARGARGVLFSTPFSPQELESFRIWLASEGRGSRNFESEPKDGDAAREIGAKLFRAVFTDGVLAAYRDARNRASFFWSRFRLRLTFEDAELTAWPWEFLYDPERREHLFWSERRSIVRTLDVPGERRPLAVEGLLRMLIVRSGPRNMQQLELDEEVLAIESALSSLQVAGRVHVERLDRPNLPRLFEKLRDAEYHVIHFMGHGDYSQDKGGSFIFENGEGDAVTIDHDLLGEFLQHKTLRLVVLNACEGGRTCTQNPLSGVAQHLIEAGAPAVIAMQCSLEDRMAVSFARYFYGVLARTGRPGQALAQCRKQLLAEGYRHGWGIPVLYLQSDDGALLDLRMPSLVAWMKVAGVVAALTLAVYFGLHVGGSWSAGRPPFPPPPPVTPSPECQSPAGLDIVFVKIPPGKFWMGSKRSDDEGRPPHEVTISNPFCLGAYEITQRQYKALTGSNPSRIKDADRPVERVSWKDAQDFLSALNEKHPIGNYRLPTEAEWEYAARGGKSGLYGFEDDAKLLPRYGNCMGKSDGFEQPVGRYFGSRWDLRDMYGNVSEWVEDWYGIYDVKPAIDPIGPPIGDERVRRGGSFRNTAANCNAVLRKHSKPDQALYDVGFRVVRDPIRLP